MHSLKLSRILMSIVVPIALYPVTFLLQMRLGYEVSLFPLYMLSIAALSWEFGAKGGVLSVLAATTLWVTGNIMTGVVYSYEWALYYNAGARTAVFIMMAYFIVMFRGVVEEHRRRMEAMRALLNVCHGCGAIQGSDGRWIPFNQLLEVKYQPNRECPACSKLGDVSDAVSRADRLAENPVQPPSS